MSNVVDLEADRLDCLAQIDQINQLIALTPDDETLKELKTELEETLKTLEADIAATKKKDVGKQTQEKWSKESQPFSKIAANTQKDEGAPEPAVIIKYSVNDDVLAKWISGDKGFYPARITSVTGSSSDPVYTIKFKGYDSVDTVRSKDIRPLAPTNPPPGNHSTKRKADLMENVDPISSSASPAGGISPVVAGPSSGVVQKAAEKYPNPVEEHKNDDDKPKPKYKKMKPTKELEKSKNAWQTFNAKGKFGKAGGMKKDSQFRVPEGPNARVGFTGSGQSMRKDVIRTRHVHERADDDN